MACSLLAVFALVFLFVPQWLIIDLPVASRRLRIWLAVGWVVFAFYLLGSFAVRLTSRDTNSGGVSS